MSTGVIESPIQSVSQLCFAWEEDRASADQQHPASSTFRGRLTPVHANTTGSPQLFRKVSQATEPPEPQTISQNALPTTPLAVRGTGEVRIGTMMIKMLKRYGITDDEIAEGLANYAHKHCHSAAS